MLKMHLASIRDIDAVFEMSNESVIRDVSLNKQKIKYSEHIEWFDHVINNNNNIFFVFYDDSKIVSQVRFKIINTIAEISISISSNFRGKGLSKYILQNSIAELGVMRTDILKIKAVVKSDNIKSITFFEKNNFFFELTEVLNGQRCNIYYLNLENRNG